MLAYAVRRVLVSVAVLFVATVLIYFTVTSLGDPLAELRGRNPPAPAHVIEQRRAELNLDKTPIERYAIWIGGAVRGDFGQDFRDREVNEVLFRRIGVTLRMVIGAMALALVLAIAVGVYSAVRQYSVGDYFFTFSGFLFLSMPVFWLGALLKEFVALRFNEFVGRRMLFTTGAQSPNLTGSFFERWSDYLGHLILPGITLALISYAAWSRYQRASMLESMNSDYVRLARSKGISERRVIVRHALRNALIPLTTIAAVDMGAVFGGAIITEQVFGWAGMGSLLIEGIRTYDPNLVMAWLLVAGVIVIVFNLIADLLYGVLDPRIRYD